MLAVSGRCGKVVPFSSNGLNVCALPHRFNVTSEKCRTAACRYSHGFKSQHPSSTSPVNFLRHVRKFQNARSRSNHSTQAASTAQQQSLPNLAGSGAGGLLPRFVNWVNTSKPPKYLWRTLAALLMGGQALVRILQGKVHKRNTLEQLKLVGPNTLSVALLTAAFVGMVFTIQFVREFAKLGLTRSVGGVLALALSRELTPVVTCIILAGRVGSAFAAELGTMQVSEQTDSLRVLGTDPVDYLVSPRVLACMIAGPVLNIMCFAMGLAASVGLAETVYGVSANVILDSACRAITSWDIVTSCIKSWVFGTIIAVVSCSWGFTTTGGAKGVGESTTSAVVISLVLIFIADFILSFLFFQGQGDALKQCM
ncbi:MAG: TRIGALACTOSYLDIACYLGLYCEROL chloroplastic-like [Trebouxia sp. A1-2]|nr:MAG: TRIGALACTOSYLDIACYLGLYCEROL chloroplastic-like [Trebouxia sp. A1-2]